MTAAVFCADACPWDPAILCRLLPHPADVLHEAAGPIRWSDACHFVGDDCRPAHPADPRRAA